jgi:cytidylate kinase
MPESFVITMDGPAASGKSSIARVLARRLGALYVNTGNMYRAVTLAALEAGLDPADKPALRAWLPSLPLRYPIHEGQVQVELGGRVLSSEELNSDAVNGAVSLVASEPAVREQLVTAQRGMTALGHLVMEGRDIGSVVFPQSPHKFYIDASAEVRAQRRRAQGQDDQVGRRDQLDSTRKTSPLVVPEGASVIDNNHLTLEQAVQAVAQLLRAQGLSVPEGDNP